MILDAWRRLRAAFQAWDDRVQQRQDTCHHDGSGPLCLPCCVHQLLY